MLLMDGFVVICFVRWKGMCIHITHGITMQGGHIHSTNVHHVGDQKLETSVNLENFKFKLSWWGVINSVLDHMNGSHLELSKMMSI